MSLTGGVKRSSRNNNTEIMPAKVREILVYAKQRSFATRKKQKKNTSSPKRWKAGNGGIKKVADVIDILIKNNSIFVAAFAPLLVTINKTVESSSHAQIHDSLSLSYNTTLLSLSGAKVKEEKVNLYSLNFGTFYVQGKKNMRTGKDRNFGLILISHSPNLHQLPLSLPRFPWSCCCCCVARMEEFCQRIFNVLIFRCFSHFAPKTRSSLFCELFWGSQCVQKGWGWGITWSFWNPFMRAPTNYWKKSTNSRTSVLDDSSLCSSHTHVTEGEIENSSTNSWHIEANAFISWNWSRNKFFSILYTDWEFSIFLPFIIFRRH